MSQAILLYDGLCGLCDRTVRFTLRHDRKDVFRFAPLQSSLASEILHRHGHQPSSLDTVVLVRDPQLPTERLLVRSDAALGVLVELGAPWKFLATLARPIPVALRDRVYDWIARNRYRVFDRYESCPIPSETERAKFLGD